MMYLI